MSGIYNLPSKEELKKLPQKSMTVYALRCALRVQPLLLHPWKKATKEYKDAVIKLKRAYKILVYDVDDAVASASARTASMLVNTAAGNTVAANVAANVAAANVAAAAANAAAAAAKAGASNAYAAADAAQSAASVYAASAAPTKIRRSRKISAAIGAATIARADYTQLLELNNEDTNASETGPLGDLWHGSPPEWYLDAKAKYDKTIAEWERELGEMSGSAKIGISSSGNLSGIEQAKYEITIQVPVDEDDETAIRNAKKLVTYVDELHKSKGGGGVTIDLLEIFESEEALVPTSPEGT